MSGVQLDLFTAKPAPSCKFFLGTHEPYWLCRTRVPLFVSRRRLSRECPKHRATCTWALDSGGFSELSMFGAWETSPEKYVSEVREWSARLGGMEWAAVQDWMCEPWITKKTGLSVHDHQVRSIESLKRLQDMAPEVPWCPVLQGWQHDDYERHVDMYRNAGVDLRSYKIVGVGSVCRRQGTSDGAAVISRVAVHGFRLHGFGFKRTGLAVVGKQLASADSMAWSAAARRSPPLPGCNHKTCANCIVFAMQWRQKVCGSIP